MFNTNQHQLREIRVHTDPNEAVREEQFQGKRYLVAPVIMLQEGVLQGANSSHPEFCSANAIAKQVLQWNGRPLVQNHPQIQGVYVSANDPKVLEDWSFGFVFNAHYGDKKLKAEAWIDLTVAAEKGGDFQDAVDRINAGEVVEVSTGLYCDIMDVSGQYEGHQYTGEWDNVISDHLAILSKGIIGACSVEAGCGIPRLQEQKIRAQNMRLNTEALRTFNPSTAGSDHDCGCHGTCGECGGHDHVLTNEEKRAKAEADVASSIAVNALAGNVLMTDAMTILDSALEAKYGEAAAYIYVISATTEMCVFRSYNADWEGNTFQVAYDMSSTGDVTFTGEPEPVILLTQILPKPKVNADGTPVEEGPGDQPAGDAPANLEGDAMADQPGSNTADPAAQAPATVVEPTPAAAAPAAAAPEPVANATSTPTVEQYLAAAPPEIQKLMSEALKTQAAAKASLVAKIKASTQNKFTDEQLNSFDVDILTNMATLAAQPVVNEGNGIRDYSGRGMAAPVTSTGGNEPIVNGADDNGYGAPMIQVHGARDIQQNGDAFGPRPGVFKSH